MQTIARPATQKQYDFIKRLVAERDISAVAERVDNDRAWAVAGQFSTADASALIDILLAQPRKEAQAEEVIVRSEPEAGIYRSGDHLVRVYLGQQSGRMLVKEVQIDEWNAVGYAYLGVATKVLDESYVRLSVDEVGSLGITTGHCLVCGRRLDDPESVDRGIGPVCASNY